MVSIHRNVSKKWHPKIRCLVAAVVLLVFFTALRMLHSGNTGLFDGIIFEPYSQTDRKSGLFDVLSASKASLGRDQFLKDSTLPSEQRLAFLADILASNVYQSPARLLDSDIVSLRHCELHNTTINWSLFSEWALHVLNVLLPGIQHNPQHQNVLSREDMQLMEQEFILELLEVFATYQGHCRFDDPQLFPGSPHFSEETTMLPTAKQKLLSKEDTPLDEAQLAIVIVAFQDAEHLGRLLESLHRPQHVIVIHLERRAPTAYVEQMQAIASQYDNVVVVRFGTVTYRTDSVSMINLQIMKWLVLDLKLQYDYHVCIGGAVYPLYSAKDLARHLYVQQTVHHRHVWLGELTGGRSGARIRSSQHDYLERLRLTYSRGTSLDTRLGFKIKQKHLEPYVANQSISQVPLIVQDAMQYKTNSGNQAVYSYETIQRLLAAPDALRLFALAKYGCCCCLEERTWIAAMDMLGLHDEALQYGAMWQVWGGNEKCESSMNNALLSTNESLCYRLEDSTKGVNRPKDEAWYIHGDQVMDLLRDAKDRGFLFARKFRSSDAASMEVLDKIRRELHT